MPKWLQCFKLIGSWRAPTLLLTSNTTLLAVEWHHHPPTRSNAELPQRRPQAPLHAASGCQAAGASSCEEEAR
eukprot:8425243-Alexandrium_andersonii.AAC.1